RGTSTTSKGNQPKWFDGVRWVKGSQLGYEDIAEYLVSKVLQFSTLDRKEYVTYDLAKITLDDGTSINGCVSNNFLKEGETLITLYRLFELYELDIAKLETGSYSASEKIKFTLDSVYESVGLDITDYLRKLLTLDALILNEDRHFNNVAFIEKDGVFRPAPIFDNGLSLLSDTKDYDVDTALSINVRRVKARTFSSSFTKQMEVLGVGFQVDGDAIIEFIEPYEKQLGRAYNVLYRQLHRYKGTIVM